jgi:hypothetical protein
MNSAVSALPVDPVDPIAPVAPSGGEVPEHLLALPGGIWALWRTLVLRGAGFPARQVLRLAAPASAEAADRVLRCEEELEAARVGALQAVHDALDRLRRDGLWEDKELRKPLMKSMQALTEGKLPREVADASCTASFAILRARWAELEAAREGFTEIHQREVARVSGEIAEIAREDLFREAVLWQNRHAVETALDELTAKPAAAARTSKRRQHEEVAASYLQRYCTKNDTIGFFGPVAFASVVDDGGAISVHCGPGLLQQRSVYFETWCIEALAQKVGSNPAVRPWLAPRVKSSFYLEGRVLHRPFGKPLVLPPTQAGLLARCDGQRTASEIARLLIADPGVPLQTEREVYRLLDDLCRTRVVTWALKVPPDLHPDQTLATLLARIEDQTLREEALAALAELQQARDRVALAAGNSPALDLALREMESTFTRLTGAEPRQRQGETYAARGLLYEDCRRDLEVRFGTALTSRLGPPLRLILDSARWVAGELMRRFEPQLRELHAQLSRQTGTDAVDCHTLFTTGLSTVFFHKNRQEVLDEIERDLQARWARVLGPVPAGTRRVRFIVPELEDRFTEAFADVGPLWSFAHYFSPDVMIAAESEAAFQRGNFELVLGEIHSGNTLLWSCFLSQHPVPEQVERMLELDVAGRTVVVPQNFQQGWPRRVNQGVFLPDWHMFQYADELPSTSEAHLLPVGAVVVEETAEGLRATTRDGRVSFDPTDLFASYLLRDCTELIGGILTPARHMPRLTLGDVIVSRERWAFTAGELDFAEIQEPRERFLALRRWARALGMPRFCFFKVATERKPCYLDFDSPISGDLFAKFLRGARKTGPEVKVSVSEMAPGLDRIWLRDGAENLYTCELRLAALERRM